MERVLGIGGIFFKSGNKDALLAWYRDNLGVELEDWGGVVFHWRANDPEGDAATVFSAFPADTNYFAPSTKDFMINFRVADLEAMRTQLRANQCAVDEKIEESELGKFGWVMDPEGNRIELWEPPKK